MRPTLSTVPVSAWSAGQTRLLAQALEPLGVPPRVLELLAQDIELGLLRARLQGLDLLHLVAAQLLHLDPLVAEGAGVRGLGLGLADLQVDQLVLVLADAGA